MDVDQAQTVAAKVRTSGAARGHLFLDLYSQQAGWSILVLDEKRRPITQAYGQRRGRDPKGGYNGRCARLSSVG
jgi:hypothetical protein